MQVTHWNEREFYIRHQFIYRDRVVAEGESIAVIKGAKGIVAPEEVLRQLNHARVPA
jgi:hypothetical protein